MAPAHFPWKTGAYLSVVCIVEADGTKHDWVINHNAVGLRPLAVIVDEIQKVVDRADIVVGHNIKFDLHWLHSIGVKLPQVHDTMVCEYLIVGQDQSVSVSLDETAKRYGFEPKIDIVKQYWKSGIDTYSVPLETLVEYCIHDTWLALQVYNAQVKVIPSLGLTKLAKLHNYFVTCLFEIESNGIKVDVDFLANAKVEYSERLATLRVELQLFLEEYFGEPFDFNMSSNDHLSVILYGGTLPVPFRESYIKELKSGPKQCERWGTYDKPFKGLGFKPNPKDECKKKGYYKTNKNVLDTLKAKTKAQTKFVETIRELSRVEKIYSTYLEGMEKFVTKDEFIHPNFNQAFTATGRLSASQPSMQNLPRGGTDVVAKRIFISRGLNRLIINGDLSALEWRVGAQLSGDKIMVEEIEQDIDIHTANSLTIFGSESFRQESKTISFRSLYGGSAYAFFMDTNMPKKSLEEWEDIHSKFYRKYSGLKVWQDENYKQVCAHGRYQSFTGRTYVFHKDERGTYSKPATCNYIVQGTATGDIVPLAMLLCRKAIRDAELDAKMIIQVHDSIVLDVHERHCEEVAKLLWNVFHDLPESIRKYWGYNWYVPMCGEIEVGPNYKETKKYVDKFGNFC